MELRFAGVLAYYALEELLDILGYAHAVSSFARLGASFMLTL